MAILKIKSNNSLKSFHFKSKEEIAPEEFVIIPAEGGDQLAKVLPESSIIKKQLENKILPEIMRKASPEDIKTYKDKEKKEKEAYDFCKSKIKERGLPMKLLKTVFYLDNQKSIFYFTAEGRIDFRDLVKDLARKYRMRIEMKQIGVRDETKILGGFGICGKPLCCYSFLKKFEPVSLQKAKDQNININPTKISGICGRLICCLNYEEGAIGRLYIDQDEEDLIQYDEEQIEAENEEVPEVLIDTPDNKNS
jgi:cell fate regulator YaaT (PSP1 superfamily)